MMPLLEVSGVRAGYGRLEILQGVSLQLAAAEIVCIIGPNGAGKSTLLKTVFGYIRPFEGAVRFAGAAITGLSPDRIVRLGLGYVAQAGGVFAGMSVRDNLVLGGYTIPGRHDRLRALDRVLERFPLLRSRVSQRAGAMSGGEQRALSIARTLMTSPRLLVLDEPSAALNRDGIALLIVEQNVEKALQAAQRVEVLDMGRNAFAGTADELRASDRIRSLYLGERRD